MDSNKTIAYISGIVVLAVIAIMVFPFTIIGAGQRGIVTNMGRVSRTLTPGLHWVTPVIESVTKFDVQTQKVTVAASAASKDMQDVSTTIAVNYNVDSTKVAGLYVDIGTDFENRIIQPALQEAVKAATAQYTAEQLITRRPEVKDAILLALKSRLSKQYIMVSEVSITEFKFSASFNSSIEAKVKADQDALTAQNKLKQIQFEAQQKIATAKAEAEAISLKSEAANNEKYVSLMKIEVQKALADKWDGKSCTSNCFGEGLTNPLPLMNVMGK
jgi:regulator of protease activity HflC (stomatin/prohibitin superfamily)